MKIKEKALKKSLTITGVSIVAFLISFLAIKTNIEKNASAVSGDIIAVEEEIIEVEITANEAEQLIHQTSHLTLTDPAAEKGYLLTARVVTPNGVTASDLGTSYVKIYSPDSIWCPDVDHSCDIPLGGAEVDIYIDQSFLAPDGKELDFFVDFTAPASVSAGTYGLKIEYNEYRINGAMVMQDFTSDDCIYGMSPYNYTDNTGDTQVLFDRRDGQRYRVRRFDVYNGGTPQCYMIDNLKLGKITTPMTLTAENTNLAPDYDNGIDAPGTYTLPAAISYGTAGNNASDQWIDPAHPAGNGGTEPSTVTFSYCVDAVGNMNASPTKCGYLYNFSAASARSGRSLASGSAPSDICPAGWQLPEGASSIAGWSALYSQIVASLRSTNPAATESAAFVGVYSGSYYSGLGGLGSGGYYWSSTVSSAANAYALYFSTSNVYPTFVDSKPFSYAVRCVRK
ncbi:hypothetical protein FACS1894191_6860 [Clostridia bacterium]|nr:hypothetical protein FACS1894191_6860 [Clostridia bacterium]